MGKEQDGYVSKKSLSDRYIVVINTSVFEHAREIETLDEIAELVDEDGVPALHVLVPESVPRDPPWFYLLPVHCTLPIRVCRFS